MGAALISRLAAMISRHTGDAGTSDRKGPVSGYKCLNKAQIAFSDIGERSGHQQRLLQAFTEDVFIFSLLVYIAQ